MVTTIAQTKLLLINEIMKLNDEKAVNELFVYLQKVMEKEKFWEAIEPIKMEMSLEELKKEQNYKPISQNTFFENAKNLQIEENLDELLAQLTP